LVYPKVMSKVNTMFIHTPYPAGIVNSTWATSSYLNKKSLETDGYVLHDMFTDYEFDTEPALPRPYTRLQYGSSHYSKLLSLLVGHTSTGSFSFQDGSMQSLIKDCHDRGMPFFLKGITSAEQARAAVQNGVDGLIVSTHGGNVYTGGVGSFDMLPRIVAATREEDEALSKRTYIGFGSGVRIGADVTKALATGADFAYVSRPVLWSLISGGPPAVTNYLNVMLSNIKHDLLWAGFSSCHDISRNGKHVLFSRTCQTPLQ